jgi:hypothetical protein
MRSNIDVAKGKKWDAGVEYQLEKSSKRILTLFVQQIITYSKALAFLFPLTFSPDLPPTTRPPHPHQLSHRFHQIRIFFSFADGLLFLL